MNIKGDYIMMSAEERLRPCLLGYPVQGVKDLRNNCCMDCSIADNTGEKTFLQSSQQGFSLGVKDEE